jgi:ubiquinol-cytochrome c reductase cytochrome b subunit
LHLSRFARQALDKVFPDHWSFMFGEIALYSFVVLVLTGVFLAFFFEPSLTPTTYEGPYEPLRGLEMSDAYASTLRLSFEVRAGLVMRQTHHWAALVFIGSIVVHLCRVFFTGAFRKPREINWVIGVTMLLLALLNGFTGYSLPDDLLSGTGLRIMYSVILSVPLVGSWVAFLLFGGEFPAEQILGRLFVLHIFLVPVLLGALLGAHLALVWHQKHTQFPEPGHTEANVVGSRLWPTYALKSVGLFFLVAAVLTDQPGVAVRTVRPVAGDLAGTARLVPRVARGRAPLVPQLGDPSVRFRDPRTVLPRRSRPRDHVHGAVRLAVPRAADHEGSGRTQPARPPA